MSVGQKYGIRNAGYYALRSLRIEKFFAFWGQDLNTLTTPLECGRESRVKLEKVLYLPSPLPPPTPTPLLEQTVPQKGRAKVAGPGMALGGQGQEGCP